SPAAPGLPPRGPDAPGGGHSRGPRRHHGWNRDPPPPAGGGHRHAVSPERPAAARTPGVRTAHSAAAAREGQPALAAAACDERRPEEDWRPGPYWTAGREAGRIRKNSSCFLSHAVHSAWRSIVSVVAMFVGSGRDH